MNRRRYYVVPAVDGQPSMGCPKCVLGAMNAAGTKRILRCCVCGPNMGGMPGVEELDQAQAIERSQAFDDERGILTELG